MSSLVTLSSSRGSVSYWLQSMVQTLASRARLPLVPSIRVVASSTPNAAAAGSQGQPQLIITTALLETLSQRELAGVLAHEIAHIAHGDLGVKRFFLVLWYLAGNIGPFLLIQGGFFWLFTGILGLDVILLGLGLTWLGQLIPQLSARISRKMEFAADEGAAYLTQDPLALANALERLRPSWALVRHPWFGTLTRIPLPQAPSGPLDTHPPTQERIQKLVYLAQKLHG